MNLAMSWIDPTKFKKIHDCSLNSLVWTSWTNSWTTLVHQVSINIHDLSWTVLMNSSWTQFMNWLDEPLMNVHESSTFITWWTSSHREIWAAHHDPDMWDDPYVYKPERFLDSEGQLLRPDHPTRRQLLLFGAGPRICPGMAYGKARMFGIICTILQKLTIKPEHQMDPSRVDPRILAKDMRIKIRFCEGAESP